MPPSSPVPSSLLRARADGRAKTSEGFRDTEAPVAGSQQVPVELSPYSRRHLSPRRELIQCSIIPNRVTSKSLRIEPQSDAVCPALSPIGDRHRELGGAQFTLLLRPSPCRLSALPGAAAPRGVARRLQAAAWLWTCGHALRGCEVVFGATSPGPPDQATMSSRSAP